LIIVPRALDRLAKIYGVEPFYRDHTGARRKVGEASKRALLTAIGVAAEDDAAVMRSLAQAPAALSRDLSIPQSARCYMPDWLDRGRVWGIALQLYQLRSARNHGIGDFEDLARFAEIAAPLGTDFIGLNPLHALFIADPAHCSPFSPSNRRLLNPLYIALDQVSGFEAKDLDPADLEAARASPLVDYPAVARLKLSALRAIWERGQADREALEAFRRKRGPVLETHALFEALSGHMRGQGHGAGWQSWPEAYRDHANRAVQAFAREHVDEIAFHAWLQQLAESQLAAAQGRARAAGMRIGLYLDLAVGDKPDGSAAWSDPELMVTAAHIGAPPDPFSEEGQNWGLSGLSPAALAQRGFTPYRETLEDVLRHAGALRIDHVMALYRLYFVPRGASAKDGAYLRYPLAQMVEALADASRRAGCIVIGEDLGTVPRGFRSRMAKAEVQSYRLLYFERDEAGLRRPATYPRKALACLSTHDLPPLRGWWAGTDIALRTELGLVPEDAAKTQRAERDDDRRHLVGALRRSRLLSADRARAAQTPEPSAATAEALTVALHRYLARAPSRLFAVRLEDLLAACASVNVPGVSLGYPNWRPKLDVPLEALERHSGLRRNAEAIAAERPKTP